MRYYVVFIQGLGEDYYDLDRARIFTNKKDADRFDAACQLDENIESTTVKEYDYSIMGLAR